MAVSTEELNTEFGTARIKLPGGYRALVALSDSEQNSFTAQDWSECLCDPAALTSRPDRVIKSEKDSSVLVKTIAVAKTPLTVIVKHARRPRGLKGLCRSLLPARAVRNFHTALRLRRDSIPAVMPLAAIDKSEYLFCTAESIYVTGFLSDSRDLYWFLRDNMDCLEAGGLKLKKQLALQIAEIFAGLHNNGLWHRDAKAGNFLVQTDTAAGLKVTLVDMDGIKPYRFISSRSRRFRQFAKLASTILWNPAINMTDYLRAFTHYCNLTGIENDQRHKVFRWLVRQAVAIRLITMARSAISDTGQKPSS